MRDRRVHKIDEPCRMATSGGIDRFKAQQWSSSIFDAAIGAWVALFLAFDAGSNCLGLTWLRGDVGLGADWLRDPRVVAILGNKG